MHETPCEPPKRHDRATHLYDNTHDTAGYPGDFRGPAPGAPRNPHQLQVIHHDQPDFTAILTGDTTRPGAHLGGTEARGVVYIKRLVFEQAHRRRQPWPVVFFQLTGSHLALVNTPQ